MKLNQLMGILGVTLMVGTASPIVAPSVVAQAKTKTTLKTFPKSIRGTWHSYNLAGRNYHAVRFTAKGLAWQENVSTRLGQPDKLKVHKLPFSGTRKAGSWQWVFAIKKQGFVKVSAWDKTVTLPPEGYYRVIQKKYQGKKIRVLQQTNQLTGHRYYEYSYTTKKLAKHFAK